MIEIASFVLDVVKCLAAPIGRQFMYLYNYKKNIDNLQGEVTKLENTRDEVQVKVTAAERNLEDIKQSVKDWQKDVDSIIIEAEKLIEEKENNPRCFKGLCPNLITRYKHSKKAFKLKQDDISQLLDKEFNEVAHPTIPQEIWLRSTKDYVALESRTSTVKNVRDALNDENIYMIAVYGMGGLGKTTLVQEVGRKAMEERLFDEMVFIEVTETPNIETIQVKIAKKLGLELDKESDVADKASKLYERLKMTKKDKKDEKGKKDEKDANDIRPMKILLILDNIWKYLDLATVGIPSGDDSGGCKLLLTTRDRDVLDRMGSTNNFKMGTLNGEEAWSLFKEMAGDVIQTPGLNSLPQDVCKECGGLPIVICAIAKALRNKSGPFDWEDALQELRAPSPTKFGGLLEEDYQKIALSYKYLRSDELRKTFLISSLMGNDTSISFLFKHVVSLDILEGANLTMERARNRLQKVVRELKDSCLLLEGSGSKQFSMHDVVRSIAKTIAYTDYHVFTEKNDIEKEWKDKDKVTKCTQICLPGDDVICKLWHEELDFPNLEFFYMDLNNSFKIHENLFKEMPKLKVLNLSNLQQSLLPSSLDCLTNLQTLCLDDSKIKDAATIGKLKKLKVLSLQNANIEELPTEIGQLTQLKLLDLSNCWKLTGIAPNVISKLSQLEELYIKRCRIQWKVEVLKELNGLSQLTGLEIDIKDNKMLPKDFFSKELKRYKISIGNEQWWYNMPNYKPSRILEFKYDYTISLEELRIVKNVELLRLAKVSDDDNNITPVFNEKVIFSNLMGLELTNICSRKIWDNQPPTSMSSSYKNLTQLTLWRCKNIKYAFPSIIAKSLMQLQQLAIDDCEALEEIIAKEEGANAVVKFVFPNVTSLSLEDLPELTAFYPAIHTSEWPMLKELVVRDCDKFTSKHLSFRENNEECELHISTTKLIFLDDKINSDLEELKFENKLRQITWKSRSKHLQITRDRSTNIPLGLLQRFENLKKLKLYRNGQYKEIKCLPDLSNLEVLKVIECRKLMTLVPSSTFFQNLKVLKVSKCNGLMMKLMTPSTARSLVQLREMSIKDCMMMIEIVENEGDATMSIEIVFNNLKKLSLKELENLECFCSGNYSFNFPSLEDLIIRKCPNMKTFSQGILSALKLQKIEYDYEIKDLENGGSDLNTTIQQAYKEQVDSKLEELTLTVSGRDIMSIWEGEFQESFDEIKTLQLVKDEYANMSIQILHKFNSLETLILKMSSYEEIFSFGEDEEHVGALTKLKALGLCGLFNLKCISKQDSRLNAILQNLDTLQVVHCHNLTTLNPSLVSFENLRILHLAYCNGMQNLMSSLIAQSLVQLETLGIGHCEMIIEVIANEGDIEEGEIVFEKLEELFLNDLERLTCFCSCFGNYTLKFPLLEELNVYECSKMKTFFGGGLSMPKLQKLNNKYCFESDIDTIIQQLQNDCSELWKKFPDYEDED